jgi:ATP-dependent DNA helicase PIF1
MAHRHLPEALDSGLRDISENNDFFGGKVVVLSGDFRQTLPIVRHGSRAQIVKACLKRSKLWQHNIETHHLLVNMRLRLNGVDKQAEDYGKWLITIGNGTAPTTSNDYFNDLVTLPQNICMPANIQDLTNWVFPDIHRHYTNPNWMCERAVLAPKNNTVHEINTSMAERFPGNSIRIESADDLIEGSENAAIPNEYLNTLNPAGLPRHLLTLKKGIPMILLRNLNPSQGLCNGTKLYLREIYNKRLMQVEIIGGKHSHNIVCIPRIYLKPKEGEFPFEWSRRQFPVSVAFAITINKSEGQTLKRAGVFLQEPVFAHGQLYVAASRVSHPQNIRFALTPEQSPSCPLHYRTRNIVYKEVLT